MIAHRSGMLMTALIVLASPAYAGSPMLSEGCGAGGRILTRYDPSATRQFAEARRNGGTITIFVNPERYFLGQRTQQWLYQRQCVHVQGNHAVVNSGRDLRLEDEVQADCQALRQMLMTNDQGSSKTLRISIEGDMERVLREGRWSQVLPGPQRKVLFDRCPG